MASARNISDAVLRNFLSVPRRIAVLGYSTNASRPSNHVSHYMAQQGSTVVGVNPGAAGAADGGIAVVPSLAAAFESFEKVAPHTGDDGKQPAPVEIVDVFRKPEALPEVLAEVRALPMKPQLVWLQEGVTNEAVEAALAADGIAVVSNRCILKEHQRLVANAAPSPSSNL